MHGASDVAVVMVTQTTVCDVQSWAVMSASACCVLSVSLSICYVDNSSKHIYNESDVAQV